MQRRHAVRTLKGSLSIAKFMNQDEVQITVTDESSTCQAISVSLDLLSFAKALMGQGCIPCSYDPNESGVLGKKREFKTLEVSIPNCPNRMALRLKMKDALQPHEVDGWKGERGDFENHHHLVKYGEKISIYRVGFSRFV